MGIVLVVISIGIALTVANKIQKSKTLQKRASKRKFRTYRVVKSKHRDVWYEEVFTSL